MIKLNGEIILLPNNIGEIKTATINHSGSNISANIQDVVGQEMNGSRAFLIGASTLTGDSTFSGKVNYYSGSVLSNEQGVFGIPYELTINGIDITSVTIVFDTARNGYPTSITVDNQVYGCNSPYFTASNLTKANSHTIKISKWNLPKYPVVIQGIYADIKINLNESNLKHLSTKNYSTSEIGKPIAGIISASGNIEFIDSYGVVLSYIQQSLTNKAKVKVYIENTETPHSNLVSTLETGKWNYDNDNKVVNITLQDDLIEWQEIMVDEMPLGSYEYVPTQFVPSFMAVVDYLSSKTPKKYNLVVSQRASDFLYKNTRGRYSYLKKDNLWNEWQKLCQACGLTIYKNSENQTIIDLMPCWWENDDNPILIQSKDIYDLSNNKLLDNKVKGIDYQEEKFSYVTDYKVLVSNNSVTEFNGADAVVQDNEKYFSKETSPAPNYPKPITYHAFASVLVGYTSGTITIPKKKGRDKILKIYDKLDNNGDPYIQYSIRGTLETGDVDETEFYPKNSVDYYGTLEDLTQNTDVYYENEFLGTVSTTAQSKTNLGTLTARSDANNFYIDYLVPNTLIKRGRIHKTQKINGIDTWYGNYEFYDSKEIDITIYGNVYKLNIETNTITIGETSNFKLENNELLNEKNFYLVENTTDYTPIGKWVSEKIIDNYKNGKETAEILCQLGDYFEQAGQYRWYAVNINGTSNLTLQLNDKVIPFIHKNNGVDEYMSITIDGQPKEFIVVGIEFIYDGAVWQKIYVQEL